jgi:hypothetical protein
MCASAPHNLYLSLSFCVYCRAIKELLGLNQLDKPSLKQHITTISTTAAYLRSQSRQFTTKAEILEATVQQLSSILDV